MKTKKSFLRKCNRLLSSSIKFKGNVYKIGRLTKNMNSCVPEFVDDENIDSFCE